MLTLPWKGTFLFTTWRVLGSSEGRKSGESEGLVKVITEFSVASDMADRSISGVYQALLCRRVLSSMFVGGRFKNGPPKSALELLLKQS